MGSKRPHGRNLTEYRALPLAAYSTPGDAPADDITVAAAPVEAAARGGDGSPRSTFMPQHFRTIRPLLITCVASLFLTGVEAQDAVPTPLGWSPPVFLRGINSEFNESLPALSADGLRLYFTSDRPGGYGSDDIWVSERTGLFSDWGAPQNLGGIINTSFSDRSPALSPDGGVLLFASNRPGGRGDLDLWMAIRSGGPVPQWQAPVNLRAPNTSASDFGPALMREGEGGPVQLYFSSFRPGGMGGADIYVSSATGFEGPFSAALPVSELNSPFNDARPTIRGDGLALIFDSTRPIPAGDIGGLRDLWAATRRSMAYTWSAPRHLQVVNTAFNDSLPALSFDGRMLVITSDRQGGDLDLYVSIAQ
jgi:hypothetical protein